MELEPRTTVPAHATGAVELVLLASVASDSPFRLRDEGDVSELAASIGRLGQLVPIELRWLPDAREGEPRYEPVCGFRRLAALRLLARDRVLARVHGTLSDEDAWAMALTDTLQREPLLACDLLALRGRLAETDVPPWVEELLEAALQRAPLDAGQPAGGEESDEQSAPSDGDGAAAGDGEEDTVEITPEQLAEELPPRMFEVNQDLALAIEAWEDLPVEGRRKILEQARWVETEILPLLEGRDE